MVPLAAWFWYMGALRVSTYGADPVTVVTVRTSWLVDPGTPTEMVVLAATLAVELMVPCPAT